MSEELAEIEAAQTVVGLDLSSGVGGRFTHLRPIAA
jgi:hypothetical protein